jgi:hypothetical protein
MENQIQLLLNSEKNIESVNEEINTKIELKTAYSEIMEYGVNDAINASTVFDNERQGTPKYRIYGRIEYISLLNRLRLAYSELKDFFVPQNISSKTLLNSFKFWLVKPSTGNTVSLGDNLYKRCFDVIATPENIEIFPAGFSKNIFGDQIYTIQVNIDIDLTNAYDSFDFPITEVYLYALYQPRYQTETVQGIKWLTSTIGLYSNVITDIYTENRTLNIGDLLEPTTISGNVNDIVEYDKNNFIQRLSSEQRYIITTPYTDNTTTKYLQWEYNPLIPIKLRYLSNDLYEANTGSTYYRTLNLIPDYATDIGGGSYVWRTILPEGYIDPLTGDGNNVPFVNKRRYFFKQITFNVSPNLLHPNTYSVFNDMNYTKNANTNDIKPTNTGTPCD